jgi:WD40 repeat protein
MAASPDGSLVASSALDDTVRLWDSATGREIFRLPGHGRLGGLRPVGFSPDGLSFTTFGDDLYLRTWDARTGKALDEQMIKPLGIQLPEERVEPGAEDEFLVMFHTQANVFSPDASLLALSLRQDFIFDGRSGKEIRRSERAGGHLRAQAISPDNRRLLSIAYDEDSCPLVLRDLASGEVLREVKMPEESAGPLAFSSTGEQYAAALSRPKNRIVIFDTATGAELQTIDDLPCRANSLCFGKSDKTLISGMADSTAIVWELK